MHPRVAHIIDFRRLPNLILFISPYATIFMKNIITISCQGLSWDEQYVYEATQLIFDLPPFLEDYKGVSLRLCRAAIKEHRFFKWSHSRN